MSSTKKEKIVSVHPPSDGSELIPAEVQVKMRKRKSNNKPLEAGYRTDEEGIINNYATEPEMYDAKYPSKKQQRRYVFLGIASALFVALAVWIAFAVS